MRGAADLGDKSLGSSRWVAPFTLSLLSEISVYKVCCHGEGQDMVNCTNGNNFALFWRHSWCCIHFILHAWLIVVWEVGVLLTSKKLNVCLLYCHHGGSFELLWKSARCHCLTLSRCYFTHLLCLICLCRVSIKESSVAKLGSVCRRIYRIFSHAYFHHRQIFDKYEVGILGNILWTYYT